MIISITYADQNLWEVYVLFDNIILQMTLVFLEIFSGIRHIKVRVRQRMA